jgi:hypothetical protein
MLWRRQAKVAELVDAHDSKSCTFGCEGSIPSFGTIMATLSQVECILTHHERELDALSPPFYG